MIIARAPYKQTTPPATAEGGLLSWVKVQLSKLRQSVPPMGVTSVTSAYTATLNDDTIEVDATAGAVTVTLPMPDQAKGFKVSIKKIDASGNAVTIGATVDATVNPTLGAQWAGRTVQSDGTRYLKLSSV